MAEPTSCIISNLMSTFERLFQFMHPFPALLPSSSSSSSIAGEVTTVEVNSIQGRLMEDLSRLSRMLRRIQAVLHDAEEREIYDKAIQLWLNELREVAYDAEDVLDEYNYQVIKTQVEGMTSTAEAEPSLKRERFIDDDDDDDLYGFQVHPSPSTSTKISFSCDMAKRLIKIIEKFDEIERDKEALHLKEEDGIRRSTFDYAMMRPPSSSLVIDSDIFGREDDKKMIIELLISVSEKGNTVIPIVGMGGVGKTTLAQLVYNDPVVCKHFSLKVWVCISEEFDVLRITKEIVTSIISCHDKNNLNDLQCMLKEALLEKRFLLVLDDVWNERPDMWEALRAPFCGAGMGKIIVTTRSKDVARIMQTMPPYELGCLDARKSWLLFQRYAFRGWELDQQLNFEPIGMKITKRCGGLPLALKAIGGFLQYEVEEQMWEDVLNNNLWEMEETKNLILPALRISYNHLPTYLKPCFVYASLFPKDHEFKKVALIRMWIAQGYIQLTGRKGVLEDIAFLYFDELQRRSFFQCSQYSESFTLHDMMHDLARSITRNEICSLLDPNGMNDIPKEAKHIFIKFKGVNKVGLFGAIRTLYSVHSDIPFKELFSHFRCMRVLRLNVSTYDIQVAELIGKLQQLRYLFIHAESIVVGNDSLCRLYMLQTLELQVNNLCKLPYAIGKLINLRHLLLRCEYLRKLPTSICQLENLLTLDIKKCPQITELPLDISKLTNLRHLILPEVVDFYIPYEIQNMISLQCLPIFYIRSDNQYSGIGWLKHLMNLEGSLNIFNLQNVTHYEDAKSANLQSKTHIKSLTLSWQYREDDESTNQEDVLDGLQPNTNLKELIISDYGGKRLPSWLEPLKSLEKENFLGIKRTGQDSPEIREINSTKVDVVFHSLEYPTVKNGDFSSLTCLNLKHCPNIHVLLTLPPNLEEFSVASCERLEYIALHDQSGPLSRLQKVIIDRCPNLKLVKSFRNHLATLKCLYLCSCSLREPNRDEYFDRLLASHSFEEFTTYLHDCSSFEENIARHDHFGPLSRLKKVLIDSCCNLKLVKSFRNHLATLKCSFSLRKPNQDEYFDHSLASHSGPLFRLQKVHIDSCPNLKLTKSFHNHLTTLKCLHLRKCPLLEPNLDECTDCLLEFHSFEEVNVRVTNCPKMKAWCEWHDVYHGNVGPISLTKLSVAHFAQKDPFGFIDSTWRALISPFLDNSLNLKYRGRGTGTEAESEREIIFESIHDLWLELIQNKYFIYNNIL